ncbi:MAG: response regulator [Bacteroidetes bacterium]|nr:response regulator [Bacteroidota bacterium]
MEIEKIEILLVEDNVDDANMTLRAFKSQNLDKNVLLLKNGEEAIDFIFNNVEFDHKKFTGLTTVILLDLHMPKIDGFEVLKKLKSNHATKHIPVVVLTGSDEDPSIEVCRKLGASNYIVKPVTLEGFIKVVLQLGHFWSDNFRF